MNTVDVRKHLTDGKAHRGGRDHSGRAARGGAQVSGDRRPSGVGVRAVPVQTRQAC